jgi:hypothetical protein
MSKQSNTPVAIAAMSPNQEAVDHGRRKLIASATMGLGVAAASSLFAIRPAPAAANDAFRPLRRQI